MLKDGGMAAIEHPDSQSLHAPCKSTSCVVWASLDGDAYSALLGMPMMNDPS